MPRKRKYEENQPPEKVSVMFPPRSFEKLEHACIQYELGKSDMVRRVFDEHIDEYLQNFPRAGGEVRTRYTVALSKKVSALLDQVAENMGLDPKAVVQMVVHDKLTEYLDQAWGRMRDFEERLPSATAEGNGR